MAFRSQSQSGKAGREGYSTALLPPHYFSVPFVVHTGYRVHRHTKRKRQRIAASITYHHCHCPPIPAFASNSLQSPPSSLPKFSKIDTSCLKCAHEGIAELVENPRGLDVVDTLNLPCTASRKRIVAPTGKGATAIPVAKSRCPKQLLESFFTTLDWIKKNRGRCISRCESM